MPSPTPLTLQSSDLWAAHVAAQADFPDERLTSRFGIILQMLADKPLDAFPQAARNAGQAKATYRFIMNKRLRVDDFLQPLVDATVDACRQQPTILSIQDSSSANFSSLTSTTGLGRLNGSEASGLHFHTTIAVLPDGLALGLLHQSFWSRPFDQKPHNGNQRKRAIEDKESYKWLDGIEAAEAALDGLSPANRPRLIHIFDREGDVHEAMQHISNSPHGAIIRAAQNRSVVGAIDIAFDAVAAAPKLGVHRLDAPTQPGTKRRAAQLELRSIQLTTAPSHNYPKRQPLTWTLVEAREVDPPVGSEPLHWLLWTTEPAGTLPEVVELVRRYGLRWRIEDFHLTLKSGCQVEKLQLETAERLTKAIILYSAVALRIMALRDLAREKPTIPCTAVLTTEQWQALFIYIEERQPTAADKIPTIKQATLWIGRLGGHLNRKRDGMPGVRTLWRGWRDLAILVAGYRAGRKSQRS
jgi:Transposase DNA-binding/Transposase Tn5 dimerisation domain